MNVVAVEDIKNFRQVDPMLGTAGQPTEEQLRDVAAAGYAVVINLGLLDPKYCLPDEAGSVLRAGMEYHHIPVVFTEPKAADFERFVEAMDACRGRKTFVHCAANYRVSTFVALYGERRLGWSREVADAHIRTFWEPNEVWNAFVAACRGPSVRRLLECSPEQLEQLADVLMDCVEGGASVSFMQPLTRERALAFWRRVATDVTAGKRALLVTEDTAGICGTVQLLLDQPENQPHRADVAKMLVHRRARRRGLGAALMRAAESTARTCGKTLLVLDTVTNSDASRLYDRLGWTRVGDIPDYALFPDGGLCSTTIFYRRLTRPESQ